MKKTWLWSVCVTVLGLILVLSTNGILWAVGVFEGSMTRIMIAIAISLLFMFALVAISWVSFVRKK